MCCARIVVQSPHLNPSLNLYPDNMHVVLTYRSALSTPLRPCGGCKTCPSLTCTIEVRGPGGRAVELVAVQRPLRPTAYPPPSTNAHITSYPTTRPQHEREREHHGYPVSNSAPPPHLRRPPTHQHTEKQPRVTPGARARCGAAVPRPAGAAVAPSLPPPLPQRRRPPTESHPRPAPRSGSPAPSRAPPHAWPAPRPDLLRPRSRRQRLATA